MTRLSLARAWLALRLAAVMAAWLSLSSEIMLLGAHVPWAFGRWWWWSFLPRAADPTTLGWLEGSIMAPPVLAGMIALARTTNKRKLGPTLDPKEQSNALPIMRGATDNHGHAGWQSDFRLMRRYLNPYGVAVGILARPHEDPAVRDVDFDPADEASWGAGVKDGKLLIDPCKRGSTHFIDFAGPEGFKTSSLITTLLHWPTSAFVMDPSAEIAPMIARDRHEWFGHTVRILKRSTDPKEGIGALKWLDTSALEAEDDVMTVVQWIGQEIPPPNDSRSEDFWNSKAQQLHACLLADILWSDEIPAKDKTLTTFFRAMSVPEDRMRSFLRGIAANSRSEMARGLARTLMGMAADETWSGVYGHATGKVAWLGRKSLAALVSGEIDPREIINGRTTMFLQLDAATLGHTPSAAKVILGAVMKAVYQRHGRGIKGRVLFALEEARRLGPMSIIEECRDLGRKYRFTIGLIYQSFGQMIEQWGPQAASKWFNAAWYSFANIRELEDAKRLSEQIGTYGVRATSQGVNKGRTSQGFSGSANHGDNTSWHEVSRALMSVDEIMGDLRQHERIVFAGGRPFACTTPAWFFLPRDAGRVDASPYYQPGNDLVPVMEMEDEHAPA